MATTVATSAAPCHFLRLPTEIRLKIYSLLFLSPTWCFFTPWYSHNRRKRSPAILQANRKIYTEATGVLYSELMLRLKPDDINYLHHALKKSNLMATESAERQGLRSTIKDIEGEKRHSTPPRPKKGVIEPRVFARFHKLDYKIDLRIPAEECFRDEPESFGIDSEEESDMIEYLDEPHTVGMVGDLVQSLSVSEVINQLSIHVQVMNCSTYYTYDIIPREDLDGDEIEWMKTQMNAVNLRVVELILERDYLRPVRELFNVKSFNLNFEMADGTFDVSQLHSRHLGLLQDLQRTVEKNWQRKQGSSP